MTIRDELREAGYAIEGDWIEKEYPEGIVVRFTGLGAMFDAMDSMRVQRVMRGPELVEMVLNRAMQGAEVQAAIRQAQSRAQSEGGRCLITIKVNDWSLDKGMAGRQ